MIQDNYYFDNTNNRHCLKYLNPTNDDLSLLRSFSRKKNLFILTSPNFGYNFSHTMASPLRMASRDKLSTPINFKCYLFLHGTISLVPTCVRRNCSGNGDKHTDVTVTDCHPIQFTLVTRYLTTSIITKCSNAARVWKVFAVYRS
jgi:hypothetical protein